MIFGRSCRFDPPARRARRDTTSSLGELRRAASDAESRAPRNRLGAVIGFAVKRTDPPIVSGGPGLDDLHLRIQRERHPRVLERDVPVGLRVVHLWDDMLTRLAVNAPSFWVTFIAFRHAIGIRRYRVVLIETADDEDRVVGAAPPTGTSARILIGRLRRLRALLIA